MTTATIPSERETLLQLLETGDADGFLSRADAYLQATSDDAYIALMACREYLKLGLTDPARDLLPMIDAVQPSEDLTQFLRSVQALPSSAIEWSTLAENFHRNADALSASGNDAAALRESANALDRHCRLFRDALGRLQLRCRTAGQERAWLPALRDHDTADRNQPLPADIRKPMPGPYLFDGIGLGGFFERIARATLDTFLGYSPPLFIIEPAPAPLAAALHLHDWSDLLSDERIFVFTGESWADDLRTALDANPNLPLPAQVIRAGLRTRQDAERHLQILRALHEQRAQHIEDGFRRVQNRYAGRDRTGWARRFAEAQRSGGLRILAAVSQHTTFLKHSMRDAVRALTHLGHRCIVLTESNHYETVAPHTYHKTILDFEPDLFFALDHLRPEFGAILPDHLPVLTWDQDQLPQVFTKENVSNISPLDFVVGYSKNRCIELGANPRQLGHARVPTCLEEFGGPPLTDEEAERYTCDVSFISHASQTPQQFHDEERAHCTDPGLRRLLDALFDIYPDHVREERVPTGWVVRHVLRLARQKCSIAHIPEELERRLLDWYLWRLGDRIFRHDALEWIASWARDRGKDLRLYGRGWDNHPTLAEFARGPAEQGRELLCIYRASRINLQLMPAGFIHQRALDGLAAGGFFLTRLVPRDLQGKALRELESECQAQSLRTSRDILDSPDEHVQRLLRTCYGKWIDTIDRGDDFFARTLKIACEEEYPDEVFPEFERITFDSPQEFARSADSFLQNEKARRQCAATMRNVVAERFSYRAEMARFLREMNTSLATP